MSGAYIAIFLLLILPLITRSRKKKQMLRLMHRRDNRERGIYMLEILEGFLGKECILYTFDNSVTGIVEEISEKWVKVRTGKDKSENIQVLNLDFITRIREYPKNKNGKRASAVLD